MTPSTTIQVVERNAGEREALRVALESLGMRVEAFASLADRAQHTPDSQHDCLICALDGAGPRWHDFDDLLLEIGEGTPVILLGRAPPLSLVVRALKAGAVDVLRKPANPQDLERAVKEAIGRSDSERIHRMRISELRQRLERLTIREQEVFQRLITGRLNKQVGVELGITERTVKAHRASILRKVAVGSLAELVRVATTLEFERDQLLARASMASKQVVGQAVESRSASA